MIHPLYRIRIGAIVLVLLVAAATIGYRVLGGYGWLESLWMVVVTISTVGFGERSQTAPAVQLLTIAVIVMGVSAAAYTMGGFIQLALEGEIDRVLGRRKMSREISALNDHVIICGFGRLGQDLAGQLKYRQIPFVVIDSDSESVALATDLKYPVIHGDATLEEVLAEARLRHARVLVSALPSDADAVFITLTARNLCPSIQIIAKSERENTCRKLRQAGVDKIVMPQRIGAQQMERMISRPSTADLVELFAEVTRLEMELDELKVTANSDLVNRTLSASRIRQDFNVLVVGIKTRDGEFLFNPTADQVIRQDDVLLVMGQVDDINQIKKIHQI